MERHGSTPIDELVRLAIIGDGTAFTKLWDTHIDSLRAYLRSWNKNLDDFHIDDICSRSFEKAFRQIKSYDPSKSQFITWLTTITHNTALDAIAMENRAFRNYESIDDGGISDTVRDGDDDLLDAIIRDEDEQSLRTYIEGLPELYRDIARKRLIEGLQYKEIADETGIELNTVRTRIRRAKALIDKMKQDEQ